MILNWLIALVYWLVYEVLSWPLRLAMQPLPMSGDIRRMLSRAAGPAMIAFAAWLLAHRVLPLPPGYNANAGGFGTIILVLLCGWGLWLFFLGAGWFLCRLQGERPDWRKLVSPITDRSRMKTEIFVEVLSLLVFLSFVWFRSWVPEMTTSSLNGGGSEKFDNSMFYWSAFHSLWLPPEDHWFAGNAMNYYYYGHYFWGYICRMAMMPGEWGIALGMARLVALVFETGYLLIRAFGLRPISAAIGAFFIAWGGNPAAFKTFKEQWDPYVGRKNEASADQKWMFASKYLKEYEKKNAIDPTTKKAPQPWDVGGYMYWNPAHAVIPYNIVEYPAWTAILGDFHAHHHSLPWNIAFFALIVGGHRWFKLIRTGTRKDGAVGEAEGEEKQSTGPDRAPPVGHPGIAAGIWFSLFLVLGVSAVISNLWVGPLVGIAACSILLWRLQRGWWTVAARVGAIGVLGITMLVCTKIEMGKIENSVVAGNAADKGKATMSSRIKEAIELKGPVKYLNPDIRSKAGQLMLHWGYQTFFLVALVPIFIVGQRRRVLYGRGVAGLPNLIAVGGALLASVLVLCIWRAGFKGQPGLIWIALLAAWGVLLVGKRPTIPPMAVVAMAGMFILLFGLEVVFIDDAMGGTHERYNSYFKHAVPGWALMTAGAWIGVHRLWMWRTLPPIRWATRAAMVCLVPFVMAMVIFGMQARLKMATYGEKRDANEVLLREPTLNAFKWLRWRKGYENEEVMLRWIRQNVPPRERVAEAVTFDGFDRYNYTGRIASLAGRPVPLGWEGHEYTWRGEGARVPGTFNKNNLKTLFFAKTPAEFAQSAANLKLDWVVFGKSEMDTFKGKTGDVNAANAVYQRLLQNCEPAFMYPATAPEVFVFRIKKP